jgi:hypothetical protein
VAIVAPLSLEGMVPRNTAPERPDLQSVDNYTM